MEPTLAAPGTRIESWNDGSSLDQMAAEVREGLTRRFKELPSKYFYDERGSELFERITELPVYYLTRSEAEILDRCAQEIAELADAQELVELGPGSGSKARVLLSAMEAAGGLRSYVPIDVSRASVERCAAELGERHTDLSIRGLVGDFARGLPRLPPGQRRLVAFLGGTIGNFHPGDRAVFLRRLRDLMGPEGKLLLGTDLVKDPAVLEAAYNDREGLTAEFNRNLLAVINCALGGDFDPEAFDHVAFYDPEAAWVEMRLRSRRDQRVRIKAAELEVCFAEGEEMRTEISAKFTRRGLERELHDAGLALDAFFTDAGGRFGLTLASPR